jgi:hypothetical protein
LDADIPEKGVTFASRNTPVSQARTPVGADLLPVLEKLVNYQAWTIGVLVVLAITTIFGRH